jgi:hypothetical protein
MIALVVLGLIAVIGLAVAWSRVGLARSERRSMQSYEHALHVLGDVSRRSDAAARIRPVRREEAERGYIRTEQPSGGSEATTSQAEPSVVADARQPAQAGLEADRPRLENVPVEFEDDSDAFERAQEEAARETVVPRAAAASASASLRPPIRGVSASDPSHVAPRIVERERRPADEPSGSGALALADRLPFGRLGAVAAAVLIVLALVLVGLNLGTGTPRHAATGRHHRHGAHHVSTPTTAAPTTTTPSALVPVSTSPQQVAFVAPKGTYNLLLSDTGGPCWVGIEQTTAGPYVWQETLAAGQSATYKASGPLVIMIGAPKYLGVKVNGLPARLPGYVQPYDLVFNPSAPPSSA